MSLAAGTRFGSYEIIGLIGVGGMGEVYSARDAKLKRDVAIKATDANEVTPKFSPDGHWLAYVSNETGRDEIYVRPIGTAGGRKRVSTEGGTWPAWARSGKELFFVKRRQTRIRHAGCASQSGRPGPRDFGCAETG
jgi:Tol biopolymer transport system component